LGLKGHKKFGVKGSQKVCTHQFSPTKQFFFSDVVYKKTLPLAFVLGANKYHWWLRVEGSEQKK